MCKQRTSLIHDEIVATTNFGRIVTVAPHDATRNSSTIVFEGRNSRTENSSVRFDERFALRTGEGKHAMPGRKLDLEEYVINRFCFDFSSKKQGKDSSVHTPLLGTTVSNVTPYLPGTYHDHIRTKNNKDFCFGNNQEPRNTHNTSCLNLTQSNQESLKI